MRQVKVGSTDVSVYVDIIDSTDGTPETGVTSASGGLALSYVRNGAAVAGLTENDLAAANSAHNDGGLIHVGSGTYRVDIPDAAFAAGVDTVDIIGTVTGMIVLRETIQLVGYDPRTELTSAVLSYLSETAASIAGAVNGSELVIRRGDSFSATLTGLGSITGYTSLWFTVKDGADDLDTASIVQIKKNASGSGDGLLYLKGAPGTAGQGSITINDAAAGNITIALDEAATVLLLAGHGKHYDIQVLNSGTVTTLTEGLCHIVGDYTRAVS